jgi:cytochrome c oxidase subunit II
MRYAVSSLALAGTILALGIGVRAWRPSADAAQEVQVVEITAERFSFTPSEIRVKAGTRLEIRLRSEDTAHGFHIIGTDIDLELPKRGRGVATVTFEPPNGRHTFECSQLCGAGHSYMRGVIIVTE